MIRKICSGCGKIIERRYSLCPECAVRMTSKRNKAYNAVLRNKDSDKVYRDPRWDDCKFVVHERDKNLCRVCFSNHSIKALQMVHHIVEVEDDISLAYVKDNLVSLCEQCHQRVHKAYREGRKTEMQARLRMIIKQPIEI